MEKPIEFTSEGRTLLATGVVSGIWMAYLTVVLSRGEWLPALGFVVGIWVTYLVLVVTGTLR